MNIIRHIDGLLNDAEKVVGILTVNITLAVVHNVAVNMEVLLRDLVMVGQIAVAVASVLFIWKRSKKMDREEKAARREPVLLDPDEGD